MTEEDAPPPPPDPGLKKMIKWVTIALIAALLFAAVAVAITIRVFQ
ncbi:MAG TPA: hypothetical protein VF147_17290 [Vicinamibacterales bacterium]